MCAIERRALKALIIIGGLAWFGGRKLSNWAENRLKQLDKLDAQG
ncbi:MAG: hypothetical protein AAF674_16845 [Pseudomonadota bacterium]